MHRSPVYIPTIPGSVVPPTPGPKTIEAIQNDAQNRFSGILWMQKDENRPIDEYFLEYDFWEPYSETKSYSKRTYQAAYKGVMRDYNSFLCILHSDNGEEHYVVAKRIPNELEALEPYCTCSRCISSSINPLKYLWCPNCTNCIKAGAGFAKQEYIDRARELKAEQEKRKSVPSKYSKYIKYIEGIPWIKAVEMTTLGVVTISALYSYIY